MKNKSKQTIQTARRIYHYDEDEWERSYLSPRGDGFVVTQWERIEESKASKAERLKFEKEMRMCKVLADNGYVVEFLHGVQRPAGLSGILSAAIFTISSSARRGSPGSIQ